MNPITLNAIAIGIFVMTFSVLLGPFLHISPALVTGLTFVVLSAVTLDSFRFQSMGLTMVLDSIAQLSPSYRQRILHHEAGHFLVACLLNLPIESYSLSLREAIQHRPPLQAGVALVQPQASQVQDWTRENIAKLCAVWAAGGVAEELKYGTVQGNEDDLRQMRGTLKALNLNIDLYERRAKTEAKQLIQEHWQGYEALVGLLQERRSVSECCVAVKPSAIST
jgi:hypothetical protein